MHLNIHLQRVVHYVNGHASRGMEVHVPAEVCPSEYIPEVVRSLDDLGISHWHEGTYHTNVGLKPSAQHQVDQIVRNYRSQEIAWRILSGIAPNPTHTSAQSLVQGQDVAGEVVTEEEANHAVDSLRAGGFLAGHGTAQGPFLYARLTPAGQHLVANEQTPMDFAFRGVPSGASSGPKYNVNISGGNLSGTAFGDGNHIHSNQDNRTSSVEFRQAVENLRELIDTSDFDEGSRDRLQDQVDRIEEDADDPKLLEKSLQLFPEFVTTKLANKAADGTVALIMDAFRTLAMTAGVAL